MAKMVRLEYEKEVNIIITAFWLQKLASIEKKIKEENYFLINLVEIKKDISDLMLTFLKFSSSYQSH